MGIRESNVADLVPASSLSPEERAGALDFTWVHRWKGSEIRSRLCVRGFKQFIADIDDVYASTPVLLILKVLLVHALSVGWSIFTYDVTTAFLHANLDPSAPPIYVWAPAEFFPSGTTMWKLKRAVYGLRTAPKEWQDHFSEEPQSMGFRRLKSDSNMYVHGPLQVIFLAYL